MNLYLYFCILIPLLADLRIIYGKIYNTFLEKVEADGVNPRYIQHLTIERSPSIIRGSPYTLSLNFTLLVPVNNNVTMNIDSHEYVENKYKRSFIRIHKPICQFFSQDKVIFPILYNNSNLPEKCPILPNTYIFSHINVGTSFMMSFVPLRKLRLRMAVYRTENKENLFALQIYITYLEKKSH